MKGNVVLPIIVLFICFTFFTWLIQILTGMNPVQILLTFILVGIGIVAMEGLEIVKTLKNRTE